jgi:putative endonuclease
MKRSDIGKPRWDHKTASVLVRFFLSCHTPFCYILKSEKLRRFYTGVCQDDLDERISKHNQKLYGSHRYTAKANDWQLFLSIQLDDFAHAVRLERKIKSMKSRKFIENLKKYPELLNKVIKESSRT